MAKGPENTFISSIHNKLASNVYKMKNHNQYIGGIPDVWYSGTTSDLWVEYKYVARIPARNLLTLALSSLQLRWLKDRYQEGRNVAVVVGFPQGGIVLTHHEWEKSFTKDEVERRMLDRAAVAQFIQKYVGG